MQNDFNVKGIKFKCPLSVDEVKAIMLNYAPQKLQKEPCFTFKNSKGFVARFEIEKIIVPSKRVLKHVFEGRLDIALRTGTGFIQFDMNTGECEVMDFWDYSMV